MYKRDGIILDKVQRKAPKAMKSLKDKPYPKQLKRLKLPTLVYCRERANMFQVFKLLKHFEDKDPVAFFELEEGTSATTRGHTLKLKKEQYNTNLRAKAFANCMIMPCPRK